MLHAPQPPPTAAADPDTCGKLTLTSHPQPTIIIWHVEGRVGEFGSGDMFDHGRIWYKLESCRDLVFK